jgi:hypothetical protein
MKHKFLFLLGIVLAHGALAAGWVAHEAPVVRVSLPSGCVNTPSAPLDYSPPLEMVAYVAPPQYEVMSP